MCFSFSLGGSPKWWGMGMTEIEKDMAIVIK